MKRTNQSLGLVYILILAIGTILSLYIPKNEVTASEQIVIPKEAIRLRILANSDSDADQALKRLVRDEVNANITNWVQELTDINDARTMLQAKQPEIQAIAETVVKREGSTQSVQIEFGKVQFPTKLYGQFLYPAGEYEAILITLGEGKGANWWCVLFPPLCFLDFSNGVAVSPGFDGQEAKTKPTQEQAPAPVQAPVKTIEATEITVVVEPVVEQQAPVQEQAQVQEQVKEQVPVQAQVPVQPEVEPAAPPVYVSEEEQQVEVKFFLKELWVKFF